MADLSDEAVTPDSLIAKYADHLIGIYRERTAGDHTFTGVLAKFAHEFAALPVLNATTANCDEPMPVEGNAEEAQTCDYPAIPGTDWCPVHDPRHVEYLADLVAEIRQKDAELEEWRTGTRRLPVDRDAETREAIAREFERFADTWGSPIPSPSAYIAQALRDRAAEIRAVRGGQ